MDGLGLVRRYRLETIPGITSISIQTLAAFVASRGIGQYIRQHFLDTTFKGLYHANAFDMALLVPYFVVLILLASYGLHRYVLVYLYYKHQKTIARLIRRVILRTCPGSPCNFRSSTSNLSLSACSMRFAACNIPWKSWMSRCSTIPPTRPRPSRKAWSSSSRSRLSVTYHHRSNREGYKAGRWRKA